METTTATMTSLLLQAYLHAYKIFEQVGFSCQFCFYHLLHWKAKLIGLSCL